MVVYPAIDLRGGKCVRLRQGDFRQETIYSDDPAQMARRFAAAGAEWLHIVDLDGAKSGKRENLESIRRIVEAAGIPCQVGGGIRSEESIRELFSLGVRRAIIGTRSLNDPDWFRGIARGFPGQIVLGIDAKEGRVAVDGWLSSSEISPAELARSFADLPLAAVVYTDIAKDGMLQGPNLPSIREFQREITWPLIASGGVSSVEDVRRLAELGVDGCIIGRALYEGSFTLEDALSAALAQGAN